MEMGFKKRCAAKGRRLVRVSSGTRYGGFIQQPLRSIPLTSPISALLFDGVDVRIISILFGVHPAFVCFFFFFFRGIYICHPCGIRKEVHSKKAFPLLSTKKSKKKWHVRMFLSPGWAEPIKKQFFFLYVVR